MAGTALPGTAAGALLAAHLWGLPLPLFCHLLSGLDAALIVAVAALVAAVAAAVAVAAAAAVAATACVACAAEAAAAAAEAAVPAAGVFASPSGWALKRLLADQAQVQHPPFALHPQKQASAPAGLL